MRALRMILSVSFLLILSFAEPLAAASVAKSPTIPIKVCGSLGRQGNTLFTEAIRQKYAHLAVEFERISDPASTAEELKKQFISNSCDLYLASADTATMVRLLGKELFVPLDAYVMRDRFDLGPFGPLVELGRSAGVLYALPASVAPVVTYYNRTLFASLGLTPPSPQWTWEEFSNVAIMLDLGRQRRSVMLHPSIWAFMASEAGGNTLTTQKVILEKTLDWLSRMLSDATVALGAGERNFYENRSPMIVSYLSSIPPQGWIGIAPLPAIEQGLQYTPVTATVLSICTTSQHPHEAWLVAKFLTGADGAIIQARLRSVPAYRSAPVVNALNNYIDHTEALSVIEAMQMAVPKSHATTQETTYRAYLTSSLKSLSDGKLLPHEVLQLVTSQQLTLQEEARKASAN